MDRHLDPNAPAPAEPDFEQEIDALMAQPIKGQPAVTIVGDDDVLGFNPPKPHAA